MRRLYQRAERFGSAEMGRLVLGARVEPHWSADGNRFWYRRETATGARFLLVDAERGTQEPVFDHERLARALAAASGTRVSAAKLPFTSIALPEGSRDVCFRLGSQWWACDLATYACRRSGAPAAPAPPAPAGSRPETSETSAAPAAPPDRSPDGRWRAFQRDRELWLRDTAKGTEARLAAPEDGASRFVPLSWSPDSRALVAYRLTPGENALMYSVESSPLGKVRPVLRQYPYALPGDRLDTWELWLFDAESRAGRKVDTEVIDWGGPPEVRWAQNGAHFTFEQTDRGYQRERILEVDARTGHTRTLVEERSRTFVYPPVRFVRYLDATHEILWTSERDGWNHLYLFDASTGTLKNQVTRGAWVVRGIEEVDEKARRILFTASGREPGRDPYLLHTYRVGFDGSGITCLTPANGDHSLRFSPDRRFYLDTYSRVDLAPVTELRRTSDASLVLRLGSADVSRLLATGWRWPEPFRAKGRDGLTDIWGVIYRPSRLDPRRKHPVIEDIYAGPQGSFVPKTFSAQRAQQGLAELGFIVVQIDGMGTANRSKAFHDVAYRNLGDSGFPDRIAWMRAAAARHPYLDLTRVGIYGVSAGGYNAARALIAHPEFYKVAMSASGNHDHRTDKVWWNELWMGYPVGPHYAQQSNVVNAAKLRGHLLLVHGEMDDNVNLSASTMQFANALVKANKDFDLLVIPGAGHGYGSYVQRRMWDTFTRYLRGVEPPKEYALKQPADNSVNVVVRNQLDRPVTLYWVSAPGSLQRYQEVPPKGQATQHSYVGHEWEAWSEGKPVSWYTVSSDTPEWVVE
jgi:dipeptidyl aminopeptidase/acylaminoacyl peptidase